MAFRRSPVKFLARVQRDHGDFVRFWLGPQPTYVVSDPEAIRDVLVAQADAFTKGPALRRAKVSLGEGLLTSEGDFHKRQRRLAQPAFHATRVAAYGRTMAAYADRVAAGWVDGGVVDVHAAMTRLTLEIVAKALFDADLGRQVDDIGEAMSRSVAMFTRAQLPFGELLGRLPLRSNRQFNASWGRLEALVQGFIVDRRRDVAAGAGADRNDLLSLLLRATDVEGGGGGMTDQQLRDECITLFTAGHETTANALAFALHLLAHHPDVQQRMQAEVDGVLRGANAEVGTSNVESKTADAAPPSVRHSTFPLRHVLPRLPTAADAADRLPYTRAVFAEAMRLYPPAWTVGRQATRDVTIGPRRDVVPAGGVLLLSQWVAHRDPRWWPDPLAFRPERFTDGSDAARPRYAYFPFAGGPRSCIGEAFAWLEGVIALATVCSRWSLRPTTRSHWNDLPLAATITLRPACPLPLRCHRRQ